MAGAEQIASADGEANRLLPEVPALPVPDAHGEAERVRAFGQRQRAEPADEMLLVGEVVGGADRIGRAEADHLVVAVEQLEFDRVRVLGRPAARPEMDLHDLAGVEVAARSRRPHCEARRGGDDSRPVDGGDRPRRSARRRRPDTSARSGASPRPARRRRPRWPRWSITARVHSWRTLVRSWLTSSTVRPSLRRSCIRPRHLLRKCRSPDRQHLVDDEDFRLEVRRDRKRQPHVHAARIVLHRRVDELFELREGDDGVELADDLGAKHAENRAVEEDVLAARQVRMEARADLEQARDAAVQVDVAFGRRGDARQDLQQRALAGAVRADDADDFADADLERDVLQRPEVRGADRRGPPDAGSAATGARPSWSATRPASTRRLASPRSCSACRARGCRWRQMTSANRRST